MKSVINKEYNLVQFIKPDFKKKFDRLTFDPANNSEDRYIVSRLRSRGSRRWFLQGWEKWQRKPVTDLKWFGSRVSLISESVNSLHFRGLSLKGKKVIDAGCGESGDADYLTELGSDAVGYDLFPRDETRSFPHTHIRGEYVHKRLSKFKIQDICESWPDEDKSVDIVICNAVLDLLTPVDRIKFYKEVKRVLKDNGIALFCFIKLANGHGYSLSDERKSMTECGLMSRFVKGSVVIISPNLLESK